MRDSRKPRGTLAAPGMWPSSNSVCSRTSISTGRLPLPFSTASWTSVGSTWRTCSLTLRINSAALGMGSNSLISIRFWNFRKYSVGVRLSDGPGRGSRTTCSLH